MATHSSTLAWKIPWTEEPGRLQSMGSLRVGQDFTFTFTFHFHALEKEMATHSCVLAWRIPGTAEPDGLPSMGSHRVRHDWSDLAAAAAAVAVSLYQREPLPVLFLLCPFQTWLIGCRSPSHCTWFWNPSQHIIRIHQQSISGYLGGKTSVISLFHTILHSSLLQATTCRQSRLAKWGQDQSSDDWEDA